MSRKQIMSVVAACILGTVLGAAPMRAQAANGDQNVTRPESAQAGFEIFGPYATMRRANEVANYYRSLGYSAFAYPNGDAYYVRVW